LCAGLGIPFNAYDPLLKAARDKLEETWSIIRGVASDKEVYPDPDIIRRLHELADSTTPTLVSEPGPARDSQPISRAANPHIRYAINKGEGEKPADTATTANRATPSEGGPRPTDGPEAGVRVWYRGQSVDVSGRTYAVINFMWAREWANFEDLRKGVNAEAGDDTVHTWICRANTRLAPLPLPWKLAADGVNRVVRKEPR
jgi:hypothetical protein